MKDHGLLVERYRPIDLDKYVGNESVKKTFRKYIRDNDVQNLILHGPAGTGKTNYNFISNCFNTPFIRSINIEIITVNIFN